MSLKIYHDKFYIARYAHLDKILCEVGQDLRPAISWGNARFAASRIGIMGNTGMSDGAHLHLDVIEIPASEYAYVKYTQDQIYGGNPKANEAELNYFMDDTLFECPIRITVAFNSPSYFTLYKRRHPSMDAVPTVAANTTIFWNRSFQGKVIDTGFDAAYGNYVIVAYTKPQTKEGEIVKEAPQSILRDFTKTVIPLVGDIYKNPTRSEKRSTFGQSKTFGGGYRFLKIHPDNFGIVVGTNVVEKTGYCGMNGTFFDTETGGRAFSVNILLLKNDVIRYGAIHRSAGFKETVLCRYRDGAFGVERVLDAQQLFVNNSMNYESRVLWAIGGISYLGKFGYTPAQEGYSVTSGSFRVTNHTTMGIGKDGFIYLVRSYNTSRPIAMEHMKDLGCELAIGLDGGGSTQYVAPDKTASKFSTRKVANQLVAIDLPL
jgi:hypothetical protein